MSENQALPTILIVDDEEFNVEIIMEYLEDGDYNLEAAYDGAEAWEKLQVDPERFDIIVLDRMMPNMNGLEVLQKIKEHPVLMNRPVILQTAMAAKEEVLEGMRAGAYYYLTKPFEETMLQSVIATAIEDRKRYKQVVDESELFGRTFDFLCDARFQIQTINAARDLATALSNAFPDPGRVVIGLLEILINAVEHGNLGITYDEKSELKENGSWEEEVNRRLADPINQDKFVEVSFKRELQGVRAVIKDQGKGFDWQPYLEMDPSRVFDSHGRGIAMSRMISFDSTEFRGCGNEVEVYVAT